MASREPCCSPGPRWRKMSTEGLGLCQPVSYGPRWHRDRAVQTSRELTCPRRPTHGRDSRERQLSRCHFYWVQLGQAHVTASDISGTRWRGAFLWRTLFSRCRADGADFRGAASTKTILSAVDLSRAVFSNENREFRAPSTIGVDTLRLTASGLKTNLQNQGNVRAVLPILRSPGRRPGAFQVSHRHPGGVVLPASYPIRMRMAPSRRLFSTCFENEG